MSRTSVRAGSEYRRCRLGWAAATVAALLNLAFVIATPGPVLADFQPPVAFPAGTNPTSVATGDFNADGKPDVAVAATGDGLVLVQLNATAVGATTPAVGNGTGIPVGTNPVSVAVGDFNGDGKPDLAAAVNGDGLVSVALNATASGASSPSFRNAVSFVAGAHPVSVAVGDINGDGKPDLVVSNSDDAVGVFLNTTTTGATVPTFGVRQPLSTGANNRAVAVGDLNGDGKPDLAVTKFTDGLIAVALNTTPTGATTASFGTILGFAAGTNPVSVAIADFNGDSKPDLAVSNSADITGVLQNTMATGATTPAFGSRQPLSTPSNVQAVAAGDLNGDGKTDLVVLDSDGVVAGWLLNTTTTVGGAPTFAAMLGATEGSHPVSVAIADCNGDGKPDLILANQGDSSVAVLLAIPSGVLQFSAASATLAEGGGSVNVALTRTTSIDGQVSAVVSATGGSATPGQDFTLAAPTTVTWADRDATNKTISIPITQDQVDEANETIVLTLTLPANRFGGALGAQTTTTVTITDDDTSVLSIANAEIPEGHTGTSPMAFGVTMSLPNSRTVTVQYTTADGTALAGTDYQPASGTLTFNPGETFKTIAVQIIGDAVIESSKAFSVTLSNPTNATLGTAVAVGTIQNDDSACTPRPRVRTSLEAGGGALQVTIEGSPLNTGGANTIQQLQFGTLRNATVTVNGQAVVSNQTVTLPAHPASQTFTVRRATTGLATTVPLTVVDGCGSWSTFVGGGASAGF